MPVSGQRRSTSGRRFIINGTLVLSDRLLPDGMVELNGSKIVAVCRRKKTPKSSEVVDARGGYIAPGFIDIHVHGGANFDFMDGTPIAVQTACAAHLRHGTTTIFPTTTTGTIEQILAMIDACAAVGKQTTRLRLPTIAGVHLYGPYFAADKAGCHSKDDCRPPGSREYLKYFQTKMIRIATCAAELDGAEQFYAMARKHRCLITCGHSNSSWSEMQRAFENGMRHVDHFWCAMSSVPSMRQRFSVPMQGSMAEFVLMNSEMSTEVIADGCHLAPELLEFAWRMKGASRLCLVTDCNRALDMPAGPYTFGRLNSGTGFHSDGRVGWAENGSLASSVKGMDHMVRHMKQSTNATLPEVIRMASLTPAERTGISRRTGSLQAGKRADLVILDQNLEVQHVIVGGDQVH